MTHEEISHVVGRSRSSVSNLIRLLQLGDDAKQLLSNGDIEMGHGRALLPLSNEQQFEVGSLISRTMTGTVVSPAILAARQRRSPAMISYLS
jgi:ParB family chromosome partitioning protein